MGKILAFDLKKQEVSRCSNLVWPYKLYKYFQGYRANCRRPYEIQLIPPILIIQFYVIDVKQFSGTRVEIFNSRVSVKKILHGKLKLEWVRELDCYVWNFAISIYSDGNHQCNLLLFMCMSRFLLYKSQCISRFLVEAVGIDVKWHWSDYWYGPCLNQKTDW